MEQRFGDGDGVGDIREILEIGIGDGLDRERLDT